jgi:hypothetical protein
MAEREGFEPSVEFPLHTLSKRARSTTPPSLRFRINDLRTVRNSVAQNPPSNRIVQRSDLYSAVCGHAEAERRRNCVRPLNVARSLTAISLSCWSHPISNIYNSAKSRESAGRDFPSAQVVVSSTASPTRLRSPPCNDIGDGLAPWSSNERQQLNDGCVSTQPSFASAPRPTTLSVKYGGLRSLKS